MRIAEMMQRADNRPSGFDYMRLCLALFVVLFHFTAVSYGATYERLYWDGTWRRPAFAVLVPMFFALSGFLVSASLFRQKTLISFYGLRILRIVPALAVEVCLSALILGPIFTDRRYQDYLADPTLHRYFLN